MSPILLFLPQRKHLLELAPGRNVVAFARTTPIRCRLSHPGPSSTAGCGKVDIVTVVVGNGGAFGSPLLKYDGGTATDPSSLRTAAQ